MTIDLLMVSGVMLGLTLLTSIAKAVFFIKNLRDGCSSKPKRINSLPEPSPWLALFRCKSSIFYVRFST